MKREILFRGKDEFGNWIFGDLLQPIDTEKETIICEINGLGKLFIKVNPKTIGQFTGLLDNKGYQIFEGDILRCNERKSLQYSDDPLRTYHLVKWDFAINGWNSFPISTLPEDEFNEAIKQCGGLITWPDKNVLENHWHYDVIGNKFDNPEMISEAYQAGC